MLREPAVRSLLLEDVCNLPKTEEAEAENPSDVVTDQRLPKALRRAMLVIAIDWAALLALFLLRGSGWACRLTEGPTQIPSRFD